MQKCIAKNTLPRIIALDKQTTDGSDGRTRQTLLQTPSDSHSRLVDKRRFMKRCRRLHDLHQPGKTFKHRLLLPAVKAKTGQDAGGR